jgi:DNA-binding IclR family transcriptional regulator
MEKGDDGTGGTQSIERAITVLRVLATHGRVGWGLTELARASGLKKATTHRILARLEHERLVHRRGTGDRYFLGPLLGELSLSIAGFHAFEQEAQEFTAELSRSTALVAILSLRSGDHFVVAGRAAPSRLKGELNEVGARRVLISTAGGVAIVVALDEQEQARIVEANRTQLSLRGRSRLDDCMTMWERSRKLGYGTNFGDIAQGVNAVAVAATDRHGRPFASLTLAGPESHLTAARCHELVATLRRETVALSQLAASVQADPYDCADAKA